MSAIVKLFGRSPFAPLRSHMDKVFACVHKLPALFEALLHHQTERVQLIADEISTLEHQADVTKNDIRNHLPKGLFLPINHANLLEILSIQDGIADSAEDVAVLTTLKEIDMPESLREDFLLFLDKNIEAFDGVYLIMKELHELLESSFGGVEAEKVNKMVDQVAFKEHEVDLLQRKLLRGLFSLEDTITFSTFHLLQRIFEAIASLSNLSEKLGYRIRMILELR